ncbi:ABC transporter permease [Immundisolibacter cernigliae]|uniref:ABC transporter permease n=1 Tax=Immundisolibacter cernigliae TaxID=1810504 RepID=UPI00096AD5CA|nr:ABC transporter permease [Immundisolibacter cernigliae]
MKVNFGLQKQLSLVVFKVYADLKAESSRSYLGIAWWFIEPLLYLAAFYILFVLVLDRGDLSFVPAFLCGVIVWKLFDAGVKGGSYALMANAVLLQQVYVPKYIFPLSAVITAALKFVPVFLFFCFFIVFFKSNPSVTWLWAIPLFFLQAILTFSLALLLSALIPFVPDLRVAVENGMMFLFFISGVFFDISAVQEPVKWFVMLNPMAIIISAYRGVLLLNAPPDIAKLVEVLLFSVLVLILGFFVLRRWDKKYGKARF